MYGYLDGDKKGNICWIRSEMFVLLGATNCHSWQKIACLCPIEIQKNVYTSKHCQENWGLHHVLEFCYSFFWSLSCLYFYLYVLFFRCVLSYCNILVGCFNIFCKWYFSRHEKAEILLNVKHINDIIIIDSFSATSVLQ